MDVSACAGKQECVPAWVMRATGCFVGVSERVRVLAQKQRCGLGLVASLLTGWGGGCLEVRGGWSHVPGSLARRTWLGLAC